MTHEEQPDARVPVRAVAWSAGRRALRALPSALLAASLVTAIGLTAVWLVQPMTAAGVVVTSISFLAVPAVVVAALMLPIVSVRSRGVLLPAVAAMALLPLAAAQVVHFGPLFLGGTQHTTPTELTVMTVNAHAGEAVPEDLLGLVREHDVDVLTVLEITPSLRDRLDTLGIAELLPHREDNLWREQNGRITYSALPLRSLAVIQEPPLWGHVITVDLGPDELTYVAVHISRPLRDRAQPWAQAHAALRARLAELPGPIVVAGDFGATLDHRPMRELARDGFTDSVVATDGGWKPTWPGSGSRSFLGIPIPSLIPIDHVLGGPEIEFHSSRTLRVPGSDHQAVVVSLGVRR